MNAVLISVMLMLMLSLARVNVVVSILLAVVTAGWVAHLPLADTLTAFGSGLGNGASVALSYGLLGAFALALAESGLPHAMADGLARMARNGTRGSSIKWSIIGALLLLAIASQNILPIHIAFIPLVVPPLLFTLGQFKVDRRLIACVITFGLVTPYMFWPVGFGHIFLNQILLGNIAKAGLDASHVNVMHAMFIPAIGMLFGLLIAVFFSYRKPRDYDLEALATVEREGGRYTRRSLIVAVVAMVATFAVQLFADSMILGALAGFIVCVLGGAVQFKQSDSLFQEGMKMMAGIGLIMIAANGFAAVLQATGDVESLVKGSMAMIGDNRPLAAFLMLLVGLIVTMGIGSSFSTVPIIATIYVPLAMHLGFSATAIVSLIGTAGALGDAGSPAADSTLGPTSGLNVDGQHDHMWDTVVPTFLHYNLPLLVFGWVAVMVL
ncbi:transporter [Jeongeupia sp. HS-3]|uniref:Na+/H+ antiporter family protein n=1 Tax=Jeongeupia sp. HS-3 TaxID=1009682 RepID=UPI0018A45FC4|nr:Na+/H+ antiporter NhaC family protein [Jeongeupia sp. HS-3]BCL74881.1 transporter [Jeongeupia sp. HS-3]